MVPDVTLHFNFKNKLIPGSSKSNILPNYKIFSGCLEIRRSVSWYCQINFPQQAVKMNFRRSRCKSKKQNDMMDIIDFNCPAEINKIKEQDDQEIRDELIELSSSLYYNSRGDKGSIKNESFLSKQLKRGRFFGKDFSQRHSKFNVTKSIGKAIQRGSISGSIGISPTGLVGPFDIGEEHRKYQSQVSSSDGSGSKLSSHLPKKRIEEQIKAPLLSNFKSIEGERVFKGPSSYLGQNPILDTPKGEISEGNSNTQGIKLSKFFEQRSKITISGSFETTQSERAEKDITNTLSNKSAAFDLDIETIPSPVKPIRRIVSTTKRDSKNIRNFSGVRQDTEFKPVNSFEDLSLERSDHFKKVRNNQSSRKSYINDNSLNIMNKYKITLNPDD